MEVGAGLEVAEAVDQADRLGSDTALAATGGESQAATFEIDPFGLGHLRHDTVIVRRAGRPHQDIVLTLFLLIMPGENFLVIVRRDQFVHNLFATPGRHDHEHVPCCRTEALGHLEGRGNIVLISFGKRRVDQELDAVSFECLGAADDAFEGSWTVAEVIMNFGCRAIERKRYHLDVGFLHLLADFVGNQGPVGCDTHAQALTGAVACNVKNILAQQRLTAGQDHHRGTDFADVVNQFERFFGIEIADRGIHIGRAAAVYAIKIAALGRLPGNPLGDEFFIFRHRGNS